MNDAVVRHPESGQITTHDALAFHHRAQGNAHHLKAQDLKRSATTHDQSAYELGRNGTSDGRLKSLKHHTEAIDLRGLAKAHASLASAHFRLAEVHAAKLTPPSSSAAGSSRPLVGSGGR